MVRDKEIAAIKEKLVEANVFRRTAEGDVDLLRAQLGEWKYGSALEETEKRALQAQVKSLAAALDSLNVDCGIGDECPCTQDRLDFFNRRKLLDLQDFRAKQKAMDRIVAGVRANHAVDEQTHGLQHGWSKSVCSYCKDLAELDKAKEAKP